MGFLLLLTSCSPNAIAPLALFSTPSVKPLVSILPMNHRDKTPLTEEVSAIFTRAVLDRLEQKDRIILQSKYPQFSVNMQLVQLIPAIHNPSELSMQIHLEILDLRGEKPKIILQEVLSSSALISMESVLDMNWNDASFRMNPLGLALRKLSREIATRIEDYILLTKKGNAA